MATGLNIIQVDNPGSQMGQVGPEIRLTHCLTILIAISKMFNLDKEAIKIYTL